MAEELKIIPSNTYMSRKFFAIVYIVVFVAGCNANESVNHSEELDTLNQNAVGNTGGSQIIGMDTARMDTGNGNISVQNIR